MHLKSKNKHIDIYKLLLINISIFLYTNVLKDLFPFPITLLHGGLIVCNLILILAVNCRKQDVIILFLSFILFLATLFQSKDYKLNLRYFVNWISLIFVFQTMNNQKVLEKLYQASVSTSKILYYNNQLFAVLIFIMLFIPRCYKNTWDGIYFSTFTVSHAIAATICLWFCLELLYAAKFGLKKREFLLCTLMLYSVLQTGARTYLISICAIILLGSVIILKRPALRYGAYLIIVLLCIPVVLHSSIADKFKTVLTYQEQGVDWFAAITSGRTVFWKIDIKAFFEQNFVCRLTGLGFDFSRDINLKRYGMYIWSHSIFLETLLSLGWLGFTLLIVSIWNLFYTMMNHNRHNIRNSFILFLYIVAIGLVNGLMDSQSYCYSIIVLLLIIRACFHKKKLSTIEEHNNAGYCLNHYHNRLLQCTSRHRKNLKFLNYTRIYRL